MNGSISLKLVAALVINLAIVPSLMAEKITVAAAADLKFAMDEIVTAFVQTNPKDQVAVVYGSTGKLKTQIMQGAPIDIFFAADIGYARELVAKGLADGDAKLYALGRLALWTHRQDLPLTLEGLTSPSIKHIAIANPRHAPYGKRAEEVLRGKNLWAKVESKLVLGDNIAHTAQLVTSGNADIGILAYSLVLNLEMQAKGRFELLSHKLHQPLEQGYVVTRRAAKNPLAQKFVAYIESKDARTVMRRYGFILPDEMPVN